MARPYRRALAFLGFWVRQLLAAHRELPRWLISLHYRIASLQGRIAWVGVEPACQGGDRPAAAGVVPSVAALRPAGTYGHPVAGAEGATLAHASDIATAPPAAPSTRACHFACGDTNVG